MLVDIDRVKEIVTERWSDKDLRPLLLFRGNLNEGRARHYLNFTRAMMLAEVSSASQITKLSTAEKDAPHLCGLHAKGGWQRMGMQSFFYRLLHSRSVLDRVQGLEEYIHWVVEETPQFYPYPITSISETTSWKTNRLWRRAKHVREPMMEFYPFISKTSTEDHELLLAVDALVPKGLRHEARADICQDMIVAILTGQTTLENIKDAPAKYVRELFNKSAEKYGHLSLDAPMYRGENAGSKTLGESIV